MKNTKRILSLFLAALMMLSVVALPVVADDEVVGEEESEGPEFVLEQDFEGYAEGAVLTTNSAAPTGTGVSSDIPANNVVKVEETETGTNKYLHIPYTGHCNVTTGAGDITGNADRNYQLKHEAVSYTDAKYGVIEIDYRWEGDNTDARFECQFRSANSAEGNINWVTLFFLEMANETRGASRLNTGATLTGVKAANPIDHQWNTIKLVFDLEVGTYDIYVNDILYAYDGVFAQDGRTPHTNITLNKDQFIAVKPNKNLNTYSEDRPGKDPDSVFVDVDNIKMYSVDDLVRINYDGRGMMVQPGQRLDFGTAGKTFVYAMITDEESGLTEFSTESYIVINKPVTIETMMLDGVYTVYEGFDIAEDGDTGKDLGSITGVTDAILESMTVVEEEGEETFNNYLKIPFSEALDKKSPVFKGEGISYEDAPIVIFEGKYLFSNNAEGTVAARLKSIEWTNDKGRTTTVNNIQLFKLELDGSGSTVLSGVGRLIGDGQYNYLQAGEWFTIRLVINLLEGTYKTYLNDTLYAEEAYLSTKGEDQGYVNVNITADSLVPVYFTMDDAVADDSFIAIDDIGLRQGPTTSFWFNNGTSNVWVTEFQDIKFSLKQRGMIFSKATVVIPLEEEEWIPAEDPETFEPIYDEETGEPVMIKERTYDVFDPFIVVTEDLEGSTIKAEYILTVAEDNFDDPENPGAALFEGDIVDGAAVLNATNNTIGLATPRMTDENGAYVFVAKYLFKDAASSIKILAEDERVIIEDLVELFTLSGADLTIDAENPAWVEVKIIIDVENGTYVVYVDDEAKLNGTIDPEFVLAENGLTVTYAGETEVAVDNIELRYKKIFKITVDGVKVEVEENEMFNFKVANRTFAYAYVYVEGIEVIVGETEDDISEIAIKLNEQYVTGASIMVEEGLVITRHFVDKFEMMDASARLGSPTGLRFVSTISKDAVNTFRYTEDGNNKRDFKFGTLIFPASYLEEIAGKFSREKLVEKYGADGFLDVEGVVSGSTPKWYSVAGLGTSLQAFAGSIANVKTENLTKKFVGIGYISFTLEDGQVVTLYADFNEDGECLSDVAAATLEEQGPKLSNLMRTTLESFVVTAD